MLLAEGAFLLVRSWPEWYPSRLVKAKARSNSAPVYFIVIVLYHKSFVVVLLDHYGFLS